MYSKESINTTLEAVVAQRNKGKKASLSSQGLQQLSMKPFSMKQKLSISKDYQPGIYRKALLFRDSMSYKKKISENLYKQLDLFQDTKELKVFGLGPYFFIEFQRRIVWLFFFFSFLQALCIYSNLTGEGLNKYHGTFGSYLIITALGNYDGKVQRFGEMYCLIIIPALIYFCFFVFYIWWKCFYTSAVVEQDELKQFVKPQKFCVEIEGFSQNTTVKQNQLSNLFSVFGPVYQVSLARQYEGNLKYFQKLDQLTQQIKQQELQIRLGSGNQQSLKKLKVQKQELINLIQQLKIKPSVRSAFIHFQFQKSKNDMLQYFQYHYLFSEYLSHTLARNLCCCCIDDSKFYYHGDQIYVKSIKLPQPDDINWNSFEVGFCGKIFRVLFSIIVVLFFLAFTCAVIGLCSVYISTHSIKCDDVTIPNSITEALKIQQTVVKKCYCNANLIASFSDSAIKNFCGSLITQIQTQQGIQYAVAATSTIVNIIFVLVVHKIVNFTQPFSHSTGYLWRTSISSIFLIFNTVFLPILIYSDILGFQATKYVSFITIASSNTRNFFKIDSIRLYVDFEMIWYRNVAPIFINYIMFDIVLTWVFFILYKCLCHKQGLAQQEGTILQKTMNEKIISWQLNASDQYANFNLIMFMSIFFCCGIPVLVPLGFLNLFSKYITNRSLLQTLSSKIKGLGQNFNSFPLYLTPIMLAMSCLVGSWMLTANSVIFNFRKLEISTTIDLKILTRELILPYFLILAIVIIFYFAFYNIIVRFYRWIRDSCTGNKQVVNPYYTHQYSFYVKTMSILHSFNIRNNIKYKNAIINLQNYLETQNLNE